MNFQKLREEKGVMAQQVQNRDMEVTVNILELASELADIEVNKIFHNKYSSELNKEEIDQLIHAYDEDSDCVVYTPEAQDIFNQVYDDFFEVISNIAIK